MRTFAITALVLVVMALTASKHAASSGATEPEFLYTVAKRYEPLVWMNGGDRFPDRAAIYLHDASGQRALVPNLSASADPAVSFDAKRVLFAGKGKSADHWQIWEVASDGSDPRQITNCPADCVRPFYLPGDAIVYAEKISGRFAIRALDRSGAQPVTLTYGRTSTFPTDVLRDGRILFEAPFGGTTSPEIYTVYSDGSGVESYRCDHGKARHSGKQVGSGDIVFAVDGGGLARFTSAVAHEVEVPSPVGQYAGDVAESASGQWLLSWRSGNSGEFQLKWWKPGDTALRTAVEERGTNAIQPVLLAPHAVPKKHPSGLHDWQVGNLLCLNSYTSKFKFAADSIHSVRIYTQDEAGEAQLLGTAPVEADGSFFVQVPGDQPLQIELLDGTGRMLKHETGWFWMRRGEQRVCVGCHAGPETAPENAVPMVLTKSTTPADMTGMKQSAGGGHQ